MFPHPDSVYEVRMLQNRDLLAQAARERLANEATRNVPPPSWIGGRRASMNRILAWISAIPLGSPSAQRLAKAGI